MRSETGGNDTDLDLHHAAATEPQPTDGPLLSGFEAVTEDVYEVLIVISTSSNHRKDGPESLVDDLREIEGPHFGGPAVLQLSLAVQQVVKRLEVASDRLESTLSIPPDIKSPHEQKQ